MAYCDTQVRRLKGIAAAGGIGTGPAFVLDPPLLVPLRYVNHSEIGPELDRFDAARGAADAEMAGAQESMASSDQDEVAQILAAHRLLFDDPSLLLRVRRLIQFEKLSAESAVRQALAAFAAKQRTVSNEYLSERGGDIEVVADALVRLLLPGTRPVTSEMAPGSVVVAHQFEPADPVLLARAGAGALVSERGGSYSHAAIIARSNHIPFVAGVAGATAFCMPGELLIVDGTAGEVLIDPGTSDVESYQLRAAAELERRHLAMENAHVPCVMMDGTRIRMTANIELLEEIPHALECGAEAIGLFRTEFLYLDRDDLPSEDEQYEDAVTVIRRMDGRDVTFRTLDLGGDKLPLAVSLTPGPNPALGLRGIRLALAHDEIFRRQLRALLRASAHGPVRIMFPLVSCVDEVVRARMICEEVRIELLGEGLTVAASVPIGAMVETPAAALIADRLARVTDFLSLGTNDLVQYTLAADRDNTDVAHICRPCDPAVLRLIKWSADAARAAGKPISVCGDMASSARSAALLIGLGISDLSLSWSALPAVKATLMQLHLVEAEQLAERALALNSTDEVEQLLTELLPDSV